MGRDNQGGAASAICARATRIGNSTMKSSKEDQALRQRASTVLQPRAALATASRLVWLRLECLVQRLTNSNVSGVEAASRGFSNFQTLALLHAVSRINPLCTPLCTAALHHSVGRAALGTAVNISLGPRIWKRGGWDIVKEPGGGVWYHC